MSEPAIREETGRNPDGTFKPGFSGNPNGRPKGSMKDYVKRKLAEMTEAEKDEFLKAIPPELVWRMAEGNPAQDSVHSGQIVIKLEKDIAEKHGITSSTINNSEGQA